MVDTTTPIDPSGSIYYSTISIMPYKRSNMFDRGTRDISHIIKLPLPDTLADNTSAEWQGVAMLGVADIVNYGGRQPNLVDASARAMAAATLDVGAGVATSALAGALPSSAGAGVNNMFPADAVNAYFQQELGIARNPNPAVSFTGPELRSYTLSWNLLPRNEVESQKIDNIIRVLKKVSLPSIAYKNTMAVLKYPGLVQFNTYPWDDTTGKHNWSDDSIIRYKTSALKSVGVNYVPQGGAAAFYKGNKHHPVAVRLTLELQEIEYMVAEDWIGSGGNYTSYGSEEPILGNIAGRMAGTVAAGFFNSATAGNNLQSLINQAGEFGETFAEAFYPGESAPTEENTSTVDETAAAVEATSGFNGPLSY